MGLLERIQRAESERAAAVSGGPAERVVVSEGAGRPHSIVLEPIDQSDRVAIGYGVTVPRRWRFVAKDMTGGGA